MPYMRVVYGKRDPAKLELGIANFKEKAVPAGRSWPGYLYSTMAVDRQTGESVTVTGWETLDAMNASDEMAQGTRRQAQEATGAVILDIDRGEMFLRHGSGKVVRPLFVRWVEAYAELDRIDQEIEFVRTKAKDFFSAQPGFVALNCGVNRMSGRLWIASSWETAEARAAAGRAVAPLNQEGARIAGAKHLRVTELELVFFHGRTATGGFSEA